jgi:hypothetical protein
MREEHGGRVQGTVRQGEMSLVEVTSDRAGHDDEGL